MFKISNTSYENEIHMVDSPSNENSKNIYFFAREALTLGDGQLENLGKCPKTGKSIVMLIRQWLILIGNTGLYSLVSTFCTALVFLHVTSNYLLKTEEIGFQVNFSLNSRPFPP